MHRAPGAALHRVDPDLRGQPLVLGAPQHHVGTRRRGHAVPRRVRAGRQLLQLHHAAGRGDPASRRPLPGVLGERRRAHLGPHARAWRVDHPLALHDVLHLGSSTGRQRQRRPHDRACCRRSGRRVRGHDGQGGARHRQDRLRHRRRHRCGGRRLRGDGRAAGVQARRDLQDGGGTGPRRRRCRGRRGVLRRPRLRAARLARRA